MTPLPNTIRDLRVLATPRPCTILLQFPPPISTPLGSRRSLAVFPPFCLHPYLCPPHTISPALKLTRFRGHPRICVEGVRDAKQGKEASTIPA